MHQTTTKQCGLTAVYGVSDPDISPTTDDGGPGWRVLIEGCLRTLPMKFARQCDAERAIELIADMTDWTQDDDTIRQAIEPRRAEIRRRMTEGLAW